MQRLWHSLSTSLRDKKESVRTLLEEVVISVFREQSRAFLKLRWRGGMLAEFDVSLPRSRPATVRTDEDIIGLVRRLALHHDDDTIAGILNKQQRTTARGLRFTQGHVGNLRRHWGIPRFETTAGPVVGELMSIKQAARALSLAPSTLHCWLNDGFRAGEQTTVGAPWRIRVNDDLRRRLVGDAPTDYVVMQEATKRLDLSRQTVLQCVKRGELDAVMVCYGRREGLRIKVLDNQPSLFEPAS